jgi:hypothetical protein
MFINFNILLYYKIFIIFSSDKVFYKINKINVFFLIFCLSLYKYKFD